MSKALAGTALGFSIVAFLLGWIPVLGWLVWLAALVLAIVAIIQCKSSESGRGMAIAAAVIMGISLLIFVGFTVLGLLTISGYTPDEPFICFEDFTPAQFSATSDGILLQLTNDAGSNIQNITFSIEDSLGRCTENVTYAGLQTGDSTSLLEFCQGMYETGETVIAELDITYLASNQQQTASCSIIANVDPTT